MVVHEVDGVRGIRTLACCVREVLHVRVIRPSLLFRLSFEQRVVSSDQPSSIPVACFDPRLRTLPSPLFRHLPSGGPRDSSVRNTHLLAKPTACVPSAVRVPTFLPSMAHVHKSKVRRIPSSFPRVRQHRNRSGGGGGRCFCYRGGRFVSESMRCELATRDARYAPRPRG